jgi:hypothetical protein
MRQFKGHGSRKDRLQARAVAALLSERSLAGAAAKAGVSLSALKHWLQDPEFQAMLAEAQRALLAHAVTRLGGLASKAVDTFERGMADPETSPSVRAADLTLTHLNRGSEILDLTRRIAEIERHLFGKADDEINLQQSHESYPAGASEPPAERPESSGPL